MAIAASVFLDWGLFSVFDVEAVRRHVPPDVELVTDDAGNATLSLNIAHFLEGGEGVELPQNHEIDLGVAVNVDNTLYAGCPQATTASHVLNIASTSADYLAYCKETGYNTASGEGLQFDIDHLDATVHDAQGPIISASVRTPLEFQPFERTAQDVVHDHRGTYRMNFVFSGLVFAIDPAQASLTLHNHPFFRGLIAPGAQPKDVFGLRPGETARMTFHRPNEEALAGLAQ